MTMHERLSDGMLPADIGGQIDHFHALGFRFDQPDGKWMGVTYPAGWSWTWRDATEGRRSHAVIVDPLGRTRAYVMPNIPGKFAAHLVPRYVVKQVKNSPNGHMRHVFAGMLAVHDAGTRTEVSSDFNRHDLQSRLEASVEVQAILDAMHPDYRNVLAYW